MDIILQMAYQTRARLIGEILAHAEAGASASVMARRTHTSHYRATGVLRLLESQELVERVGNLYYTSRRGRDFLRAYKSFRRYSESVGVTV